MIGRAVLPGFGLSPAYLVMAQTEPGPHVPGPNEAVWRRITVVSGPPANASPTVETSSAMPDRPVALPSSQGPQPPPSLASTASAPKKVFDPRSIPEWRALTAPVAAFDLNGTWELDEGSRGLHLNAISAASLQTQIAKLSIYQLRDAISVSNTERLQYFPPGAEILYGAYSAPYSVASSLRFVDTAGRISWKRTTIEVKDDDHIQIAGTASFHRTSRTTVQDVACDPHNSAGISAKEAFARSDIYASLHDHELAVTVCWNYVAAAQGHAMGQNNYGYALLTGTGVAKDPAGAFSWFQKSAMQTEPYGEGNLSKMFRDGVGAPPSVQRQKYWANRAGLKNPDVIHDAQHNPVPDWARATAGPCDAANPSHMNANDAVNRGTVAYEARALEIANCWFQIGADQSDAKANVYLGILNAFGLGVQKDTAAAFAHMEKGVKAGDLFGMAYLANFYRYGIGTAPDMNQGSAWMKEVNRTARGQDVFMRVQGLRLTGQQIVGMIVGAVAGVSAEDACSAAAGEHERTGQGPAVSDCPDAAFDVLTGAKKTAHYTIDTPEEIFSDVTPY
jgi:TPR repeat protein